MMSRRDSWPRNAAFLVVLVAIASPTAYADPHVYGAAEGEASHVQITATAPAWVRVHDAGGTAIFTHELQQGESYRVPDRPGLLLDTGNAKALDFTVDGSGGRSIGTSNIRRDVILDSDKFGMRAPAVVATATAAPAVSPVVDSVPTPAADAVDPPGTPAPTPAIALAAPPIPPPAPIAARSETAAPSVRPQLTQGVRPSQVTVSSAPENATIEVETGKGVVVHLHSAASTVFVSNPEVADIQVKSPSLIYLFGKAPGETSLYAANSADQVLLQAPVRVTHNLSRLRATLSRMMPDEPIGVESVEGAIVLTGNVSSAAHSEDARALANLFAGPAQNASSQGQGQTGPSQNGAAQTPQPAQGQNGNTPPPAGVVLNRLSVIAPNQVNLRVRVAEVNRGTLQALGINWNHMGERILNFATANVTLLANQAAQNILQIGIPLGNNSTLSTELDAMAQEGLITTLAEPNLTAMSGQTASFLAGGEFPVPVSVNTTGGVPTVTVDYKKFGVSVEFLPTILDSRRVSLRLLSEVSELSTQGAVQISGFSIPALTVRRAETSVELGSGSSFVIAGLLQNNAEHDVSKIPALGDIPILGPLFRSDRFRRQETELVIIVTPYLVQPTAFAGASPTDGLVRLNNLDRPLSGAPYRQTPPTPGTAGRADDGRGLIGPAGFQLD